VLHTLGRKLLHHQVKGVLKVSRGATVVL